MLATLSGIGADKAVHVIAQLESLKEMLRTEMEEKSRYKTQAEGIASSAGRLEATARSARFTAEKARAEVAVLEGALTGSR